MTEDETSLMEQARLDDLKQVAGRPEGRRFLATVFRRARCLAPVYVKSADVYKAAAVQAFALHIWKEVHAVNPEASRLIFEDIMAPPIDGEEEKEHA